MNELIKTPILLKYSCSNCKKKIINGVNMALFIYHQDCKYGWYYACCQHLFKIYQEKEFASLEEFESYLHKEGF